MFRHTADPQGDSLPQEVMGIMEGPCAWAVLKATEDTRAMVDRTTFQGVTPANNSIMDSGTVAHRLQVPLALAWGLLALKAKGRRNIPLGRSTQHK